MPHMEVCVFEKCVEKSTGQTLVPKLKLNRHHKLSNTHMILKNSIMLDSNLNSNFSGRYKDWDTFTLSVMIAIRKNIHLVVLKLISHLEVTFSQNFKTHHKI